MICKTIDMCSPGRRAVPPNLYGHRGSGPAADEPFKAPRVTAFLMGLIIIRIIVILSSFGRRKDYSSSSRHTFFLVFYFYFFK